MKPTNSQVKVTRNTGFGLAALILAIGLGNVTASAPQGYPPLSVLAAKWWQWAGSLPASQNPLLDPTGQFAALNQPQGNIWFLAGNTGGSVVRSVTVPAGKALFFPVVNAFDVEDGIATPGGQKVFMVPQPLQTAQAIVQTIIATANNVVCTVDGAPVTPTFEQSSPFAMQLPDDNIFGVPAGNYFPAVDSGYCVLLAPLASGQHVIHFSGGIGYFNDFTLDVTINLTVQ